MENVKEILIIGLILINFFLLSSSRLKACVKVIAAQGFIVGLMPLLSPSHSIGIFTLLGTACIIGIKSFLLPTLLYRSLRNSEIRKEVEPYISYSSSVIFGIAALIASFFLSAKLPFPPGMNVSVLAVPVSISTFFVGLFIVITRKKAFSQVLGYLVFENGIYFAGAAMLVSHSFIVELGILLDVFVLVFIMGITVFHINNEFDHIDTNRLNSLSDMPGKSSEED